MPCGWRPRMALSSCGCGTARSMPGWLCSHWRRRHKGSHASSKLPGFRPRTRPAGAWRPGGLRPLVRHRHSRRARDRRQRLAGVLRRRRDQGRPHRRDRRAWPGPCRAGHRRAWHGGHAGLHRHAGPVGPHPAGGRPRPLENLPGGHHAVHRRRRVGRAAQRQHPQGGRRARQTGMANAGRLFQAPAKPGHRGEPRHLRRRRHGARNGDRLRRPQADPGRAGADAGDSRGGDARRRLRRFDGAAIPAGHLQHHPGTGRAGEDGGELRRHLRHPHAQRRRCRDGRARRGLRHRAQGAHPGRDLPPQGGRPSELGRHAEGDREDRRGARRGAGHTCRHLCLHRLGQRPGLVHSALGARRRHGRAARAAQGPASPRADRKGHADAVRRMEQRLAGSPRSARGRNHLRAGTVAQGAGGQAPRRHRRKLARGADRRAARPADQGSCRHRRRRVRHVAAGRHPRAAAAVGIDLRRRRGAGAHRPARPGPSASARLCRVLADHHEIRAPGPRADAGGSGPQDDGPARAAHGPRATRPHQEGHVGRYRHLRPGAAARAGDVRRAEAACAGDGLRTGQRRAGDRERQDDRRPAGQGAARARI